MSQSVSIWTEQLKPSQNYLKEDTLKFILTCWFENRNDLLPPPPIVRKSEKVGEYIAIDGHNLIAIYDLFNQKIPVYIVENAQDELVDDFFSQCIQEDLLNRKSELKKKYNSSIREAKKLERLDLSSFSSLRNKYSYLVSQEKVKRFYQENCQEFVKKYFKNRE
jgi:hypothetical protein